MNVWEKHYVDDSLDRQRRQNYRLSRDFLGAIKNTYLHLAIAGAERIVEFGCGTGELSVFLKAINGANVVGQDISENAIQHATDKYGSICAFTTEPIENFPATFDLAVSSNTLEHFHDTHSVLDKLFAIANQVLLLIPYNDKHIDPSAEDGGLHHVVTLNEESFEQYRIIAETKFKSNGWENGSDPLQWALLLERK